VWDEEHDLPRVANEEVVVNAGRHWLHFNVDSSTVTVTCVNPNIARKYSSPDNVGLGDDITYVINLPANPALARPADASVDDPLPAGLSYNGDLDCSLPGCEYDAERNAITWEGTLGPDETFSATFSAHVDEDGPALPTDLQNCADTFDGEDFQLLCTTTGIDGGDPELGARIVSDPAVITNQAEPLEYTITVPGSPAPDAPDNAFVFDPLPEGLTVLDDEDIHCSFGECDFDAAHNAVRWVGTLTSHEELTLSFDAVLTRPPTSALDNCAQFFDGHAYGEVCTTTEVDLGSPATMVDVLRE
jgi:uncharacterized repeat protein (TIGR01451 family)